MRRARLAVMVVALAAFVVVNVGRGQVAHAVSVSGAAHRGDKAHVGTASRQQELDLFDVRAERYTDASIHVHGVLVAPKGVPQQDGRSAPLCGERQARVPVDASTVASRAPPEGSEV